MLNADADNDGNGASSIRSTVDLNNGTLSIANGESGLRSATLKDLTLDLTAAASPFNVTNASNVLDNVTLSAVSLQYKMALL